MAPIRCCFDQTAVWHSDAARGPSTPSFDHLVGAGEQRRRNFKAKDPGSLSVDDEFELARLHDWQTRRLGALEDAAHIGAGLAPCIHNVRPVAHQPANFSRFPVRKTSRYAMPRRESDQLNAPAAEEGVAADDKRIRPLAHNICECCTNLSAAA